MSAYCSQNSSGLGGKMMMTVMGKQAILMLIMRRNNGDGNVGDADDDGNPDHAYGDGMQAMLTG